MKLLEIILRSFLIAFVCYAPVTLIFRTAEYMWMRRISKRKPDLRRFVALHAGSVAVIALFTPAMVYLVGGQVMIAMGYPSPAAFHGSQSFWIMAYLTSTALPLQFHYTVNSRLTALGDPLQPDPAWMPWVWTVMTFASVAIAWIPLWLGWLTLADMGVR